MKYHRLTLLRKADPYISPNGHSSRRVWAQCDCGVIKSYILKSIKSGHVKSCGCYAIERTKEIHIKHGMATTREYHTWQAMVQRCYNPKNSKYKYYGARGIKVCSRWLNSFEAFYEDMGNKPKGLTLERVNNNRGYGAHNCKWATFKEQNLNRRKPRKT